LDLPFIYKNELSFIVVVNPFIPKENASIKGKNLRKLSAFFGVESLPYTSEESRPNIMK